MELTPNEAVTLMADMVDALMAFQREDFVQNLTPFGEDVMTQWIEWRRGGSRLVGGK